MDREAVIRAESDRFGEVLAGTDPAAPVPTCPGWSAHDLLDHLVQVHDFWARVLGEDVREERDVAALEESAPPRPDSLPELLAAREAATTALLAQLAVLEDQEPRWSWWPPDQTVGFTRRMQTSEATIHRVDAELTAGLAPTPLTPEVAAGAVDQCVDVMWGYVPAWAQDESTALVELVATDTADRWTVDVGRWHGTGPESGNAFDLARGRRAQGDSAGSLPTATATATAHDLALWAWGRGPRSAVGITGDPVAVAALDRLVEQGIQ
ncbi:maleylpyruvate isomerase family mycothiol-dependent enzyme [Ornithinimicrobium flavum]|uniref:maleylpyruvate isomerase family mycothiol-dependent enzyme n=1 Tax=Ornithinimicrobium flavum TaxID=1288636 RepID=UPI00106FD983|nr:maleylpyruvate isomerase family mycothiol-dependent enzyme [Ornithinimicrobium flavum]